jgi:hypothetical protein
MASVCSRCGAKFGLFERLSRRDLCDNCQSEVAREREQARQEYLTALDRLPQPVPDYARAEGELSELARRSGLTYDEIKGAKQRTLRKHVARVLADQILTEQEEQELNTVIRALDVQQQDLKDYLGDDAPLLMVARINSGRMAPISNPSLLLKRGESAYWSLAAALMKEVLQKEYQGRSSGVSFRIAKGVRYHVGQSRGNLVVTGSSLVAADTGFLWITSQRAVYMGAKQTLELPYAKLLNVETYTDGIRLHVANRKTPPLFMLEKGMGWVATAAINAAAQHMLA